MTAVSTSGTAPHPRLRVRARLVLAGLSACGLAALAWASFVHPLPRLTYNPSDSVAVGWYRVDPLDHQADSLPSPLSVNSIVLVPLPAEASALAAQPLQNRRGIHADLRRKRKRRFFLNQAQQQKQLVFKNAVIIRAARISRNQADRLRPIFRRCRARMIRQTADDD